MFKGKRAWLPDESRKLVMKISLFEQISLFDEMKIDRLCLVKKTSTSSQPCFPRGYRAVLYQGKVQLERKVTHNIFVRNLL